MGYNCNFHYTSPTFYPQAMKNSLKAYDYSIPKIQLSCQCSVQINEKKVNKQVGVDDNTSLYTIIRYNYPRSVQAGVLQEY